MSVRKKQITRKIPANAERVTVKGEPAVRFTNRAGKKVAARLTKDGTRMVVESRKWYGHIPGEGLVPLGTSKTASEIMLGTLLRAAEMGKAGAVDPYAEHRARPLSEHLEDYLTELASTSCPEHVRKARQTLRALFEGCKFTQLDEIDAAKVATWLKARREGAEVVAIPPDVEEITPGALAKLLGVCLQSLNAMARRHRLPASGNGKARRYPRATAEALAKLSVRGISLRTSNYYLTRLKAFCTWLADEAGRMAASPVARLKPVNANLDQRHLRQDLTAEQLGRLLAVAQTSTRTFRDLSGPHRHLLYATACGTGFRAGALASLTPAHFDLTAQTVTLYVRANKSRRKKVQPIPADLVALLTPFLAGKPADELLWPGAWTTDPVEILRPDLDVAGIPYVVPGPDGPLHADFHSLRHSYLTILGRAGVDLRTLQELAGHSSPVLTARYSHRDQSDLARAVARLPGLGGT